MEANLFLLLASGVMLAAGVYLMLDRAVTKIVLGLLLIGNAANLLILQAGGPAGSPPITGSESSLYPGREADPLAQAMILTAMALTAFLLSLAYRQYRYRSADVVEDDHEDAAIAARPINAAAGPDHDASDDPKTGRATEEGDRFGPESFEKPVEDAKGTEGADD